MLLQPITLLLFSVTGLPLHPIPPTHEANFYLSGESLRVDINSRCLKGCVVFNREDASEARDMISKQIRWAYEAGLRDARKKVVKD